MQLFYGTRHRINVIGTLLPVFVGEKLDIEQVKRQTFQDSLILTSIFAIIINSGHHLYSSTDEALASFPSIVGKAELEIVGSKPY